MSPSARCQEFSGPKSKGSFGCHHSLSSPQTYNNAGVDPGEGGGAVGLGFKTCLF